MGDILAFWTNPLRSSLLVAIVIVVLGIILFARRPKMKKSARAPENTAKHPSEYQDLPEFSRDVGKVVIKKRVSAEEQIPMVADGVMGNVPLPTAAPAATS